MRRLTGFVVAVLLALGTLMVAGCGAASSPAPVSGVFTGKSSDANLFVAVAAATLKESGTHGVLAYACDGDKVSQWFRGAVSGNSVDRTATNGAKLTATVSAGSVKGTLTLADGRALDFEIPAATKPAGLYRFDGTVEGQPALGGWIVLGSGEQKGLALSGSTLLKTGSLNTTTQTTTISSSSVTVVGFINPLTF